MRNVSDNIEFDAWVHARYNVAFIHLYQTENLDFGRGYLFETMNTPFFRRDNNLILKKHWPSAKSAINVLTEILDKVENEYAYELRAVAYFTIHEIELCIDDYSSALSINPNLWEIYNNRGVAYSNVGRKDLAILDYDTAIRVDANNPTPYFNRGQSRYFLDNYEGAIEDYEKAIQIEPTDLDFLFAMALVKERCADFDGAVNVMTQAIDVCRIEDYEDLLSYFIISEDLHELRARCREKMGDFNGSNSDYERCKSLQESIREIVSFGEENSGLPG